MLILLVVVTVVSVIEIFWPASADKNQEQEEHSVMVITDNRNEWGPCSPDTHRLIETVLFTFCQHWLLINAVGSLCVCV